jgi:hypothetical protein
MKKYLVSITYCQDIESVEVEANSAEEAEKIEQAEIEVVELGEALLRVADAGLKAPREWPNRAGCCGNYTITPVLVKPKSKLY